MIITRDNYESFFLDYLEGNLEEAMIDQFLDFLEQNPDLKGELQLFENLRLPEEQVSFSGKKQLYKSAAEEKLKSENQTVAYLEGDMDDEERKSFEAFLSSHPDVEKEYKLVVKTRLIPDLTVKYANKHALRRQTATAVLINWVARVAAAVVLVWGVSSVIQDQKQAGSPNVSEQFAESAKATLPVSKPESGGLVQVVDNQGNINENIKVEKPESRKSRKERLDDQKAVTEREPDVIPEIEPLLARLETESAGTQLAFSRPATASRGKTSPNVVTIDEFLVSRARKAGAEGLFSVQRIARVGLGVAAELSGERIGYSVNDGKISSVDFESKILAFSIPLTKK